MISKNKYYKKPKFLNSFKTLKNMKQFCEKNNIKVLALPNVCAELDKKCWHLISALIKIVIQNSSTQIKIYCLHRKVNVNDQTIKIDKKIYSKKINVKKKTNYKFNKNNMSRQKFINRKSNEHNKNLCLPQALIKHT